MDYPGGCFFTDYIFIGEGNQTGKKNESLKIRVPIMYLFKTTDVAHSYIHFFFNLSKLKKIVLFFSFLFLNRQEGGLLRQSRNLMSRAEGLHSRGLGLYAYKANCPWSHYTSESTGIAPKPQRKISTQVTCALESAQTSGRR